MLLLATLTNTKLCKNPEIWLKLWHMGTQLRVLFPMYVYLLTVMGTLQKHTLIRVLDAQSNRILNRIRVTDVEPLNNLFHNEYQHDRVSMVFKKNTSLLPRALDISCQSVGRVKIWMMRTTYLTFVWVGRNHYFISAMKPGWANHFTLMLLVANLVNTKWCKHLKKYLFIKPRIGTLQPYDDDFSEYINSLLCVKKIEKRYWKSLDFKCCFITKWWLKHVDPRKNYTSRDIKQEVTSALKLTVATADLWAIHCIKTYVGSW